MEISWQRPILHAKVELPNNMVLDVINLHLKSRRPTNIQGHRLADKTWKTASGWAEGVFISSMKRIGQALETRILIDKLFDEDQHALIAVCGDFNEEFDEVAIEAIRGDVENTGNMDLAMRVLVPTERNVPEPARYSFLHNGKGKMLDHILVSRTMLAYFRGTEVHNELLHDTSTVFTERICYPESDHAPVIAHFELPETKIRWRIEAEDKEGMTSSLSRQRWGSPDKERLT